VRAALSAVDAARLVDRALASDGTLAASGGVWLIAAGKAAAAMASAAGQVAGSRLRGGMVVGPGPIHAPQSLETIVGGHPVPTAGSEQAGRRAIEIARHVAPGDRLLLLLSGGASALMALPADGITLDDKCRTTDRLLRAGADIHALNTVRKHLSAVKGGWLAASAAAPLLTLAISDVVGDDPSVIGSGPTVADRSTFEHALDVLRRYGGEREYPRPVTAYLKEGARGARPETPKPGDLRLDRAQTTVIGGRHDAMRGAATEAATRGYRAVVLEAPVVGEARDTAPAHVAAIADLVARAGRPLCVISSGETTVRVNGTGQGGRNQEFALAAAGLLPPLGLVAATSAGTDGVDGPTSAAGAIVDNTTIERAERAGLAPPSAYLDDNNSHAFFAALGDLVTTGPTGTNVGDLQVFLLA
jgi:glycerate 2-kinase